MHELKHQTPGSKPASPTAPPSAGLNRPTRRNFIVWALGGLLGAIVAAVTAPILVYLYPPKTAATAGTLIRIALGTPVDGLGEGGAVQFDASPNTALVMADGGGGNAAGNYTYGGYLTRVGGRLHALAITSPHLGCCQVQRLGRPRATALRRYPSPAPISVRCWPTVPGGSSTSSKRTRAKTPPATTPARRPGRR